LSVALLGASLGGALAADGVYGKALKVGSGEFASSAYNSPREPAAPPAAHTAPGGEMNLPARRCFVVARA